jgi:hypothetical protein
MTRTTTYVSAALRGLAVTLTSVALTGAFAVAANAKECSKIKVSAASEPSLTRVVAYPASLLAWRKAAEESAGAGYNNWSSSEDRRIDCNQTTVVNGRKLWVCKRTARPCRGLGAEVAAGTVPPVSRNGTSSSGSGSSAGGSSGGTCSLTFPAGRKSVRPGDKGSDVIKIQQALIGRGATLAKGADGNFGSGTERAVRDFQRSQGISPADGFVGRTTCSKMGL